ncbi:ATP-dependent DNA helicase [Capnocytophaga catalasegens]|uniref:ATP-dependent exodeoxyribonuclease n=1 Tax=Capnocytophaga catalasegens TaxID=1004260 RepID=A0AAV5ASW5_9FLAO|nr:AAA family ATPase [Capnocytophaga catalasegens]GIZ14971.1 ATP-dependent exodeoxyribonuclease [Capnocytophaga catalasegens]GJM49350.1 ATP-dependent exodeoxyribonuclease [Capnocytophaga catalasegens]GJM52501.1 ATP-dependent exodeoxyribonuclease [Capnocytophaga catalasegens]
MNQNDFFQIFIKALLYKPTSTQYIVLQAISEFLLEKKYQESIFVLKGFAGTGKTTIIGALVSILQKTSLKVILLAPTGRAAKVITEYSGHKAYTIHKHIYYSRSQNSDVNFVLKTNKSINTLYIVDEASMISNATILGENSVLDDLVRYVYSGTNCRLMLVGDTAQLPPVHLEESPALDSQFLSIEYRREVNSYELTQVVRQKKNSGILYNATQIREQLTAYFFDDFTFELNGFDDIIRLISGIEIQEALETAYSQYGIEQTTFIVRSNKRASLYNKQIRKVILGQEEELSIGDLLMVVKNNYFWLDAQSEAGFIANGDTIEVLDIYRFEQLYGFEFAEVKVQMIDYPNQEPFDTILLLDVINSQSPSLTYEQNNQLYQAIMEEYQNETSGYRKYLKIKNNPYFNALQIKYSYAVTCHKSQGGQWDIVFIEKPYLPEGITMGYLRWLYTAITRAKKKVFLINFENQDFQEDDF